MAVEFLSLKKLNALYEKELLNACRRVIQSGWYIQGEQLQKFEKEFSSFVGSRYCIGVSNGFDALKLVLKGYIELGYLSHGDEVLVPANTFIASALAINEAGLTPVFVDPPAHSFNFNLESVQSAATNKTRAIMPVHLYGQICPMHELCEWADEHEVLVLEDCAQAHGAELGGRRAGSFASAGAFSFYPGKVFGALGDAGAITTDDPKLADIVRAIANYGSKKKYQHKYKGVNCRMDEIQAAMLSVKLGYLEADIQYRREVAESYNKKITNTCLEKPLVAERKSHVWHLYVVKTKFRDKLQSYLSKSEIQSLIHYPIPLHKQEAYKEYAANHLPNAERYSDTVLSLPISPVMQPCEVDAVIASINDFSP